MTKKRPSSRDQKALVISDANLMTAEQQEKELLQKLTHCLSAASRHARALQKLKEVVS